MNEVNKIRVMVVDDSALMRRIISDMLNEDSDLEVIGTARNGADMFTKLTGLKPDVVTLDVEMPQMNGMEALKEMKDRNLSIPVIMLSSVTKEGTVQTMECLAQGAFDFVSKPSGSISINIETVKNELVKKIKAACLDKKNEAVIESFEPRVSCKHERRIEAVAIGTSTGGPKALHSVLVNLPGDLGVPVFVVQHMPLGFTKAFSERLDASCRLKVVEAQDGMNIEKNVVYVAQAGYHMEVGRDKKIHLNSEPPLWGVRPCVDKLFESAAKLYGSSLMSVVMTGMGRDGAKGTEIVHMCGGCTVAQDRDTSTIYGMPRAACETGKVQKVVALYDIANEIVKEVQK